MLRTVITDYLDRFSGYKNIEVGYLRNLSTMPKVLKITTT